MEGPSITIAVEEFAPFIGKRLKDIEGTSKLPLASLEGHLLNSVESWGKHFILTIGKIHLRIHFLMFGSYRINKPRSGRTPKLQFRIGESTVYFYSCAIKVMEKSPAETYDWSVDIMSKKWSSVKAKCSLGQLPKELVCDVLMDQKIFSGVGNIIKNEVLFLQKIHPEITLEKLTVDQKRELVRATRAYSLQFYRWKKINQLKRNWQVFRKRECPVCDRPLIKKKTGKLERVSYFCRHCQPRYVVTFPDALHPEK